MTELEELRKRVAALEAGLEQARGPQDRLRHEVFSQAPLVLFALNTEGIFTLHEGRGASGAKVKPGALLGTSIREGWGRVPGVVEAFERALAGHVTRWEGGNGVDLYESIYAPQLDAEGRVVGVSGISVEVTARKRADEAVRRSEARFRGMIEKSHELLFLCNAEGRHVYGSPSIRPILECTPEEVLGRPFDELIHPEDRAAARAAREALLAEPGGSRQLSYRMVRLDGVPIPLEVTLTNLLHDPDVGAMVLNARNVTERKRAEAALLERQHTLEQAQEVSHVGSWSTGPTVDDPISWTPECARIFRRPHGAPPTVREFLAMVHPEDQARFMAARQRAIDTHTRFDLEHRFSAADGGAWWAHTRVEFQRDADDHVARALGVVRDITERHLVTEALMSSEERYRRIVETTSDGVATTDSEMHLTFVNGRFAELLGYTRDELLGRISLELMSEEARQTVLTKLPARRRGLPERFDLRLLHKDGHEISTSMLVTPLMSPRGEFEGVLAQFTDLSDRREKTEQQNRLAAVVESSGDAIVTRDLDGIIRTWNPAAERLFQYVPSEIIGKPIATLYPPEDMASLQAKRPAVDDGSLQAFNLNGLRRDGTRVEIAVRISTLRDADGQVQGVAIIARDLSGQRKAEADLRRAEDQLRQAQKMESVGRLAGGIAHDFNNLLTVIISYTDLALADLKPGERLRDDLEQVEAAGQRAAALTRQLLAFSRQQVLEPQIIDLNRSVRGLEHILGRILGEDVQLTLLLENKVGRVFADPGQVEQVLMNLVVNARDAMPLGGSLTIETADVQLDATYASQHHGVVAGPYVMLAVTDTGSGMSRAVMERMFEPFFTTKEKGKGTGLGLATVFGIVKQSGGHIWVYSEPGVGSTFKVYLPRTDREVSAVAAPPPLGPLHGTETVLLVEDETAVRNIMRAMLRKLGYHVLEAQNGGEALLICEQYNAKIHLLITDVIMPRMNGRQLAERLAVLRPEMRVLYVSGYTENTIVHHGILDAGITYLPKPVTPDALARKMREVLG